ncbi:MAG: Si-specific NAD(P)(+) transhydrogenase [Candidatus Eisenbacteria bacterium]|nr:Si-specific NAD(P)(+) transhydrogenase [Candidatus Latescibacterota bacterium]MBD3301473.1 Si-specific NAD(P)(+) transhydrogenase [Candidatus Eisenbacteria bacterium]
MDRREEQYDLVCIGSGPAGQRAAVQAAKLGKRAAVVEKSRIVGGVCIDTGTIPSKTFREAVLSFTGFHLGFGRFHGSRGLPPVPTASELLARVTQVIEREAEIVERQLRRNGVRLLRGTARFEDPHTIHVESETGPVRLRAEKIVIAVGTRPAPIPEVGGNGRTVFTSEEIIRIAEIPRRMAVVGAGVVGMEYASMFGALGTEVTLIDQRRRPLEFLDAEIVDELIHQMRDANVFFRLGERVESIAIEDEDRHRAVLTLASGKRVVSDLVLYSVGRIGATDGLDVEAAGLEPNERGRLDVNEIYRTKVPHIFAAGDVIGFPSLAATSSEQGRIAACHAFDYPIQPMKEHFPVGIYAIPEVSMVGEPEGSLTERSIPYEVGMARYREIARGQILQGDSGMLKMLFHREDRRLLGVHAIGTGATELIHVGQAVLAMGGGLDYFLETVFNYPTLAECYKVAALDAANRLAR